MKKGDEAMLLIFYSDTDTSNGFGANAPKKGIALIPFVKKESKAERSIASSILILIAQGFFKYDN